MERTARWESRVQGFTTPVVALVLAVVIVLNSRQANPSVFVAVELLSCAVAAASAWFPRPSVLATQFCFVLGELSPRLDATMLGMIALLTIAVALVQGFARTASASTASMLAAVIISAPRDHAMGEAVQEVGGWVVLLLLSWTIGLSFGYQERQRQLLTERFESDLELQRMSLARQLHDTIARSNARIALQAEALKGSSDDQEILRGLESIVEEARHNGEDLRSLVDALQLEIGPVAQPEAKFAEVLEREQSILVSHGFHPLVVAPPTPYQWTVATEVLLCRVLQEACHNIVKHAARGQCSLMIGTTERWVEVLVANSIAPRKSSEKLGGGFGLISLQSDVSRSGGHLSAQSNDQGTWVLTARLPREIDSGY